MIDLRLGDVLAELAKIESNSVDLVFLDPPFNVGKKYGKGANDNRTDYYEWCEEWTQESFRVLKDTGSIYLMTIPRHLPKLYPMLDGRGVFISQVNWRNVSAARHPRSFWNSVQPILVFGKTKSYKFNQYAQTRDLSTLRLRWGGYSSKPRGQLLDYWDDIPFVYAGSVHHKEAILKPGTNSKVHPCQMPVALIERAILFSTDEGDTVLEPFAGLAAGAVACKRNGRNYIGIDQSAEYISIGTARAESDCVQPLILQAST